MRILIYKLFFIVGLFASILGIGNSTDASISFHQAGLITSMKTLDTNSKLYFSDVINNNADSQLYAAHYSHRSHSSHRSHTSHYSSHY